MEKLTAQEQMLANTAVALQSRANAHTEGMQQGVSYRATGAFPLMGFIVAGE